MALTIYPHSAEVKDTAELYLYSPYGVRQWRTQEFCTGGVQQIQLRTEDTKNGDLGEVAPLVRGSGGSCNLVQEISFHIVKFS